LQGYARSGVDHSMFLRNTENRKIVALVYVYYIILAENDINEIE